MSNLRVLLVTDAVGGVWVYSLELARALKPLGIDCILAVTGPSPSAERRESAAEIRMIDTRLPLEWLDTTAAEIAAAGGELASIARRECVDVVQTCSAALLAGRDFDCPAVAVQHSCVATWWKAVRGRPLPRDFEWRRRLVEQGLEAAGAIVAPSAAFARATERAYRLDKQVLAVPNGRTPPHSPMLPQGDFALTAARLWDEGKNVATLDRAAARIDAPFQAAGPTRGPNGASVRLDHLIALGELGEAKLGGLLSARPVFASAALYEPFGLSVLEAAQAGCALVLSDIPTHRELWDGAAMFVAARDDRALALAIDELLHDREKRRRLGDSARAHARKYTPARTARAMAQIYVRLTHGEPRLDAQLIAGAA